jgi:hypothetical protein
MNERIRELTFKAGAKLYSEPPTRAVTGVTMSFESVEKFAELIVQECCKVVRDEIQYQDSYDMADGVIDGVKNYFGVEE